MKTEDYLTGTEKQQILQSHERILAIIPEITGERKEDEMSRSGFAGKPVQDIFREYYRFRNPGGEASDELMSLLNEVLGGEQP